MVEINLEVTRNEFGYRDKSILELLESSHYQDSDARKTVNDFLIDYSAGLELSIDTQEEIRPVVTEKFDFEYRDLSKLIASFG